MWRSNDSEGNLPVQTIAAKMNRSPVRMIAFCLVTLLRLNSRPKR